jgi:hypothetical protein
MRYLLAALLLLLLAASADAQLPMMQVGFGPGNTTTCGTLSLDLSNPCDAISVPVVTQ